MPCVHADRRLIELHDAGADGETFEVDGRAIPIIGRDALLQNERATDRDQDIADVKALEHIRR